MSAGAAPGSGCPSAGEGRWGGLAHHVAVSVAAGLTTWAATWGWRGFTVDDEAWLAPLLVLSMGVPLAGALGRWAGTPRLLLVPAQLVLAVLLAVPLVIGTAPGLGSLARVAALLARGAESARLYAAPVPADVPSVAPLLIAGGLACVLTVDLLAATLHRAALAGLPLLAAYALPVSMLGDGVPGPVFATVAAGFLAVLALQEDEGAERWGRRLAEGGRRAVGRSLPARVRAAAIGAAATALALLLPVAVPTAGVALFEGGFARGGDGDIELEDPMVDLRRDLKRGDDMPLVAVVTDDPDPDYLRITVLERFSANAWTSGGRDLPDHQRADGDALVASGVDAGVAAASHTYRYSFTATDRFSSEWLPHPFPVVRVQAPGNWKYDLSTLDFLAADEEGQLDTAGLSWRAAGLDPAFDEVALTDGPSPNGFVDPVYTELPEGLPAIVTRLTASVTAHATTDLGRAKALQRFFRSDGGFRYSLTADDGNGGDALAEFLTRGPGGRTGYCEQFASAMAVMARVAGIPARVSIGFLEPQEVGRGRFVYSTDDLHAWPELYFAGQGWVRFEPTPGGAGGRAQSPPPWSVGGAPVAAPEPSTGRTGEDPLDPDRDGTAERRAESERETDPGAGAGTGERGGARWRALGGVTGALLLLGLLAAAPRTSRRLRSARRWRDVADGRVPAGLAAWRELRERCTDLRVSWPDGLSPQATRRALRPAMAAGPITADAALGRIVGLVEREWYAAPGAPGTGSTGSTDELRDDVELVVEALADGVSSRDRLRASWLPVSALRPLSRDGVLDGAPGGDREAARPAALVPVGADEAR